MSTFDIQKRAIEVMTLISVAVTNIRLYPPTSAIIRNTIDRVYQLFVDILKLEPSVIFAESGKNYIVCGQFFSENDQKRYPQAISFLELMSKFGIRSVAFEKRLGKPELRTFLEIISRSPEDIDKEGGLPAMIQHESLPNIIIDHKMYVVVDKDQRIVASIDVKDEDIVRFMVGENPLGDNELQKLRDMARDPKWVNHVFRAGMAYIMGQRTTQSYEKLSDLVLNMIQTLDDISEDIDREKIALDLAQSIADMDDEMILLILSQDTGGVFSEKLFDEVLQLMDDEKFERIASRLKQKKIGSIDAKSLAETETEEVRDFAEEAYDFMMRTGKGQRLQNRIQQRVVIERTRQEKRLAHLKAGLTQLLKGEDAVFYDEAVMTALPEYVLGLLGADKQKTAEGILQKLGEGLRHDAAEIRARAALVLSHVGRLLLSENRIEPFLKILPDWLNWVRTEPSFPDEVYERTLLELQELAQKLILNYRIPDANPILEALNHLHLGVIETPEPVRRIAGDTLKEIASEGLLDLALEEFQSTDSGRRKQAITCLSLLGDPSISRLLGILEKSRNMSERARILQIIPEIGEPAAPVLARKIEAGGAWFYLRNLILLLGKVGRDDHLRVLIPLLKHEDFRVQRETLTAIYNIGGDYRGELLLSAFPDAEERLKSSIVDMLGALKYRDAVNPLIELLETKSFFSTKITEKMKEKACVALGRIGSTQALPALRAIVSQKSLLGIKAPSETVRGAAADAIREIESAQSHPPALQTPPKKSYDYETIKPEQSIPTEGFKGQKAQDEPLEPLPRDQDTVEESAVSLLYEGIVKFAREKSFEKAEALREKLIQLDSMALAEIIRSGEIIEEEKNASGEVNQDHLGIWPELYDMLSPEEADALYYALEEKILEPDQIIFRQGESNSRLYFIRRGDLKLVFTQGERETLLKTLGKGSIVGEDTFFSVSVCTTSLITLSRVYLIYLEQSVLTAWKDDFPALQSKLHDFCLQFEQVQDILKKKGMDRRSQKRIRVNGLIQLQLGQATGASARKLFKGSMIDISVGGVSFLVRSPNRKNVSLLLGRKLLMDFDLSLSTFRELEMDELHPKDRSRLAIRHSGMVISVSHHIQDDYSVHIKFESPLAEAVLGAVRGASPRT